MRILMVSLTILLVSTAMACGTGTTEKAEQPTDRPVAGAAARSETGPGVGSSKESSGQSGLVENPGPIPSGGPPKDGIPSIDSPGFISLEAADRWIGPQEAVLVLRYEGRVRVYPLQILMWHEIVNDEIDGQSLDFGTTG